MVRISVFGKHAFGIKTWTLRLLQWKTVQHEDCLIIYWTLSIEVMSINNLMQINWQPVLNKSFASVSSSQLSWIVLVGAFLVILYCCRNPWMSNCAWNLWHIFHLFWILFIYYINIKKVLKARPYSHLETGLRTVLFKCCHP